MSGWLLGEADIERIALGAAVLGTGGGGNVYLGKLRAREQLRAGRRIEVISPDSLADDDLVICVGGMGAPTVGIEKIERGDEGVRALRALEASLGRRAAALMTDEIGGANAIEPLIAAALTGLPVVDGDGMGRAFPELQMTTFLIYGTAPAPGALCDEKGNAVVMEEVLSPLWLEQIARAVTVAMGCTAGYAGPPLSGHEVKRFAIRNSMSQAWRLGQAVLDARAEKRDPVAAILAHENGRLLFRGKVVDVARWTTGGFARGRLAIEGVVPYAGASMRIDFQNENLVAAADGETVVTVPDLICIVDAESGRPISTEEMRYGLRVAILGLPSSPLLRTPEALAVVGPRAFGYEIDYRPLGDYLTPEPVTASRP